MNNPNCNYFGSFFDALQKGNKELALVFYLASKYTANPDKEIINEKFNYIEQILDRIVNKEFKDYIDANKHKTRNDYALLKSLFDICEPTGVTPGTLEIHKLCTNVVAFDKNEHGEQERFKELVVKYIDTKDTDGNTPLHYAVYFSNLKAVAILLEKNANITKNSSKQFPYELIRDENINTLFVVKDFCNGNNISFKYINSGSFGCLFNLQRTTDKVPTAYKFFKYRGNKLEEYNKKVEEEYNIYNNFQDLGPKIYGSVEDHKYGLDTFKYIKMELFNMDGNGLIKDHSGNHTEYIRQLFELIDEMVKKDTITMDIKPDNTLVNIKDGSIRVVLTDFSPNHCVDMKNLTNYIENYMSDVEFNVDELVRDSKDTIAVLLKLQFYFMYRTKSNYRRNDLFDPVIEKFNELKNMSETYLKYIIVLLDIYTEVYNKDESGPLSISSVLRWYLQIPDDTVNIIDVISNGLSYFPNTFGAVKPTTPRRLSVPDKTTKKPQNIEINVTENTLIPYTKEQVQRELSKKLYYPNGTKLDTIISNILIIEDLKELFKNNTVLNKDKINEIIKQKNYNNKDIELAFKLSTGDDIIIIEPKEIKEKIEKLDNEIKKEKEKLKKRNVKFGTRRNRRRSINKKKKKRSLRRKKGKRSLRKDKIIL